MQRTYTQHVELEVGVKTERGMMIAREEDLLRLMTACVTREWR